MNDPQREYVVTLAVSAAPHKAAKLRTVLRDVLELEGFNLTAGVVTVERWLVEAMAVRPVPFRNTGGYPEAEHTGKLRKRQGRES